MIKFKTFFIEKLQIRSLETLFQKSNRALKFFWELITFDVFEKYVSFNKEASNSFISNFIEKCVHFHDIWSILIRRGAMIWLKVESRKSRKSRKSHARFFNRISQSREIEKVRDFPKPNTDMFRKSRWFQSQLPCLFYMTYVSLSIKISLINASHLKQKRT